MNLHDAVMKQFAVVLCCVQSINHNFAFSVFMHHLCDKFPKISSKLNMLRIQQNTWQIAVYQFDRIWWCNEMSEIKDGGFSTVPGVLILIIWIVRKFYCGSVSVWSVPWFDAGALYVVVWGQWTYWIYWVLECCCDLWYWACIDANHAISCWNVVLRNCMNVTCSVIHWFLNCVDMGELGTWLNVFAVHYKW